MSPKTIGSGVALSSATHRKNSFFNLFRGREICEESIVLTSNQGKDEARN